LDTLDVGVTLGTLEVVASLGEERDDCSTGVTTDDGDVLGGRVGALDLGDEARRADDIEGGDTEEALGVVDTLRFEDLSGDGDGGVNLEHVSLCIEKHCGITHGVGNDEDVGIRAVVGASCGEIADDGSVCVEKVVTGHAGLARNTSGDEDDLSTSQALLELRITLVVASNSALCVDVADIGGDTGSTPDIVESELGNSWVELEEERERLADTASSTEDSDTGVLYHVLAFGALLAFLVLCRSTHESCGGGEGTPLGTSEHLTSGEHD